VAKKLSAFGKQFKAARDAGLKQFSFGGKAYTTKQAGGKPATRTVKATVAGNALPQTTPVVPGSDRGIRGGITPGPSYDTSPAKAAADKRFSAANRDAQTRTGRDRPDAVAGDAARLAAAQARARAADPTRTAADVADTRKRMELVTGSPSPRGTAVRTASVKPPTPVSRPTQVQVASTTQPLATATRVQPVTGYAKVVGREVTPPSSKMARTGPRLGSPEPMAAAPPVRQPAKFYVGKRIAPDVVKTTRVAAQKGDRKANAKASTFSTANGPHDYSRLKFFHPGKG
jgi:hypothetical protein